MRLRQYAYFGFTSQNVTASMITGRLGIEPDRILVRGSRTSSPPVPRFHTWRVTCAEPGLRVDQQIAKVIERVRPRQNEVELLSRELLAEGPRCGASIGVVRHFEEGEEEVIREGEVDGLRLESLPGQHQLLGWHLDAEVLAFLVAIGAELDVDEYG